MNKELINNKLSEYLKVLGFDELSEVQKKVLDESFKSSNMVVESVTGSGKTHAFLIPLFMSLDKDNHDLQVVITSPTKELARQIFEMAKPLRELEDVDMRLYVGGDDLNKSIEKLKTSNPQIAIGTPGRIKQLSLDLRLLSVHKADLFIVDEADMTLDSGFIPQVDLILSKAKKGANFEVFSATIREAMDPFLKKYLSNPIFIKLNKNDLTPLNIEHVFIKTKYRDKVELLKELMSVINPYLAIIYCNKIEIVEELYSNFSKDKRVTFIHGDLDTKKRKQIMRDIKDLKYSYIISTDLTARGLDIEGVTHIINYELPKDPEFYIHRTGRTGRMFKDGIAISFYEYEDDSYIDKLESKGLKTVYKIIKDNSLIEGKSRYERERKTFESSRTKKQAEQNVRFNRTLSKNVKPGYKKKFQEEVKKEQKEILKKRKKRK